MEEKASAMEYKLVICGGTFDRLHKGHKAFLHFAFTKGEQVIIGITSDAYVAAHKKDSGILPFSKRKSEVESFLHHQNILQRAKIVAIESKFDQTQIPESTSVALLVSEETRHVGEEINEERVKQGLMPLHLLIFPMMYGEKNKRISSSGIREGTFDRNGVFLPNEKLLSQTLVLSQKLRSQFHKPFGMFYEDKIPQKYLDLPERIVAVGDVTTKRLHQLGITPKLCVVDFHVERKATHETLQELGFLGNEEEIVVENPAGSITKTVWKKLMQLMAIITEKKNFIVIVTGEEDLLTIPLILMLPLGFVLFYGQPAYSENDKKGVVVLEITEELKQQTYRLLKQFDYK